MGYKAVMNSEAVGMQLVVKINKSKTAKQRTHPELRLNMRYKNPAQVSWSTGKFENGPGVRGR